MVAIIAVVIAANYRHRRHPHQRPHGAPTTPWGSVSNSPHHASSRHTARHVIQQQGRSSVRTTDYARIPYVKKNMWRSDRLYRRGVASSLTPGTLQDFALSWTRRIVFGSTDHCATAAGQTRRWPSCRPRAMWQAATAGPQRRTPFTCDELTHRARASPLSPTYERLVHRGAGRSTPLCLFVAPSHAPQRPIGPHCARLLGATAETTLGTRTAPPGRRRRRRPRTWWPPCDPSCPA